MKKQITLLEAIKLIESSEYTEIRLSFVYCVILGCYVEKLIINNKYYVTGKDAEAINKHYLETV